VHRSDIQAHPGLRPLPDHARLAGIRPAAWVANQTLTATGTRDPILAERAAHGQRWLADILERHEQLAVVPWQANAPTGAAALAALVTDAPGVPVGAATD
jgi:arsenite-transporting ATPase